MSRQISLSLSGSGVFPDLWTLYIASVALEARFASPLKRSGASWDSAAGSNGACLIRCRSRRAWTGTTGRRGALSRAGPVADP